MQQSNTYVIVYSAVLTIILGLLLSGSAQVLGPWQQEAIALDKKKQILGAVISAEEIASMTPDQVNQFYSLKLLTMHHQLRYSFHPSNHHQMT